MAKKERRIVFSVGNPSTFLTVGEHCIDEMVDFVIFLCQHIFFLYKPTFLFMIG